MTTRETRGRTNAVGFLESLCGKLTLGRFLRSIREGEDWSLETMGQRLGISPGHVCDVEHGRRVVSPERAARWARLLGYDEKQMVQLALQGLLDGARLRYAVSLRPHTRGKKRAA
jgi:transcriptional regulator with XRE-family HTH domain